MRDLRRLIFGLALLMVCGSSAHAATIRGSVLNGTTAGPGAADLVRLMDVSTGEMDQIQVLQDVDGSFVFPDVTARPAPPYLIQAQWQGVIYSGRLAVPEDGEIDFEITVYDATENLDGAVLAYHHALFQRQGEHMRVSEVYDIDNRTQPPVSIWQPQGPIWVDLPHDVHGEIQVSVKTETMTLHQELLEVDDDPTQFTIPYPLRPGSTTLFIRYEVEYQEALEWSPRFFYPTEDTSFLVSPEDVDVSGPGIEESPEGSPVVGYSFYQGPSLAAGERLVVSLDGGSEMAADPHAGMDIEGGAPAPQPRIEVRPNRYSETSTRGLLLMGVSALLLLSLVYAVRSRPTANRATDRASDRLSELEDRFVSGQIGKDEFLRQRDQLRGGNKAAPKPRERSVARKA